MHQAFFFFQKKKKSPLSVVLLSPVKVIFSESGEKYVEIKHHLQAETVQNNCVDYCDVFISCLVFANLQQICFVCELFLKLKIGTSYPTFP